MNVYQNGAIIGQHESFLDKVGEQVLRTAFRVTFVSDASAQIKLKSGTQTLSVGMVVSEVGALIQTNESHVQITSLSGFTYRLGTFSEFSIEATAEGVKPVTFGNVYQFSTTRSTPFVDGGKYRTSCYTSIEDVLVENISDSTDIYYSFEEPVTIYEYDERGARFEIAHMGAFERLDLSFTDGVAMRERYSITHQVRLTNAEIDRIYLKYVLPTSWR